MKTTTAKVTVVIAVLSLTIVSCANPASGPLPVPVPHEPPASLVIVAVHPRADQAAVAKLVATSARTDEQLEIVSSSGTVIGSGTALAPPVIPGPTPPPPLPPHPTEFQVKSHDAQEQAFNTELATDRRVLTRMLASDFSAWAGKATAAMTRAGIAPRSDLGTGLSAASAYFVSLQQAGLNLGPRRVLVIYGASGLPGHLTSGSLSGITVILANFQGSMRQQEEWQAALLQAGAERAIVLVPAAAEELVQATRQALAGQAGPPPVDIYFGLNRDSLQPTARLILRRIADELTTTYRNATVTILGFADPLGSAVRNAHLSANRAQAVRAFLVAQGVAVSRISAEGYGTDLPAAPEQPDGVQPQDRRAIVIIDQVVA